jgi:aspartate aminotransferase
MKSLAKRLARLGNETAFRVLAKAQALEVKGVKVIHLEIGEPDFATPGNIVAAACSALEKGHTRYANSQGIVPLRDEIARYTEKTRGISVDPARIVVTPGAKPIIFYAILSLLEEGDEAIYPDPGFPIYKSMIDFSGAKAVPVPLREELDFRLDLAELESLITARTKLIILNSPENPTGGVLSETDIRAIAALAKEHDIYVLSDEVYEYTCYEGSVFSIASIPGMIERTILMNGFSKTYAMTGWRAGWGILPQELVGPFVAFIGNSVSCTATFTQYACIEALSGNQDSVAKMVQEFGLRRDVMVDGLNSIPGVSCRKTRGAFYAFANFKSCGRSSAQMADYLLNEAGVACLAGSDFGRYGEGYIRFSYANSQENIREAIDRIKIALGKLAWTS